MAIFHGLYLVFHLLLLACPAKAAIAAWYTDLGPNIAIQDEASGSVFYSSCNSNHTPIYPTDQPNRFNVQNAPRNGTALAITGWFNSKTTYASIFYQNDQGQIINGYYVCNFHTGQYVNNGDYVISDTANVDASTINSETGLAVELLGSSSGYRLFYHDQNRVINMLMYTTDTNWQYGGIVSSDPLSNGMALASGHSGSDNITVIYPRDQADIGVSRFNSDGTWRLSSLPRPLEGGYNVTNATAATNITLDYAVDTNFTLPAFDGAPGSLGFSVDSQFTRNIFYIGTDRALHQAANINYSWRMMPDQQAPLWPVADVASAQLGTAYSTLTSEAWVYYLVNGSITQLYVGSDGLWRDAATLPTFNATAPTASDPSSAPPSNALSTAAKAGIGVAAGLGTAAIIGAIALCLVLRHRKRKASAQALLDQQPPCSANQMVQYAGSPGSSGAGTLQPYGDYGQWTKEPQTQELATAGTIGQYQAQPAYPGQQTWQDPLQYQPPYLAPVYELEQRNRSHELVGEGHYRELADNNHSVLGAASGN